MPIDRKKLIEAISILANEKNVRITVKQSGKGAIICAACCFAGGVLLGPVGMAIGGAAGGITAYMTQGSFRSLGEVIINDLSDAQKELLVQKVTDAVKDVNPADLAVLLPLIMTDASIQQAVLNTVVSFVASELSLEIID